MHMLLAKFVVGFSLLDLIRDKYVLIHANLPDQAFVSQILFMLVLVTAGKCIATLNINIGPREQRCLIGAKCLLKFVVAFLLFMNQLL